MTTHYLFDDTKNDGSRLHGAEWDVLVRILDSQLQGALALHGAGVAAIPDRSSLLVEIDTGGVVLNPGACVLLHSARGYVWAKRPQALPIASSAFPNPNSSQNFVHVAIQFANMPGGPDTRENGTPLVAISSSNDLDGHELLAQITLASGLVTNVIDRRRFLPGFSDNVLWSLFFGSGRIAGANRTYLQPVKKDGELVVILPAGSQWFLGGKFIVLDVAVEIDVPASEANGVWGLLSLDDAGLPAVKEEDWLDAPPPRGAGVLGLVKTGADAVISVSETTRDVIQAEPAKQARFEAIETLIAELSGDTSGEGDPESGVTRLMYNALKKTVEDLARDLTALKDSLGGDSPIAVRLAGRVETLRAEHSRLAGSVVRQSPRTAKRLQSAVVLPGLSGIADNLVGGDTQKTSYIGGNLRINRAKRRLE